MDIFDWEQFNDAENNAISNFQASLPALDIPSSCSRQSSTAYSEVDTSQQVTTPEARPRDNLVQNDFFSEFNSCDHLTLQVRLQTRAKFHSLDLSSKMISQTCLDVI